MKKTISVLLCLVLVFLSGCSGSKAPKQPAEDYSASWRDRPIPESFDLRSVDTDGDGKGDRCFVTPVRFQNPFGTCWGFAAMAAAETSILGSHFANDPDAYKTLDFSEKQLAYFANTHIDDPDNPQNGEGMHSLLDEPTAGADEASAGIMLQLVRRLCDRGAAAVLVTHHPEELRALCRRVVTLEHGVVAGEELLP